MHQIRNSLRYIAEKDKKPFMVDLKPVYQALTKEQGYENLIAIDEKWGKKHPVPITSWYNNWENLSTFFKFDARIRKVIYTINSVEGFHRQVRKITKTKGCFYFGQCATKTGVFGRTKHIREMDNATP